MCDTSSAASTSQCSCVIHSLIQKPFRMRSYEEKKEIAACPRPQSELTTLTKKLNKTQVTRHFNTSYYKKYSWLCGCASSSSLFCWPCICFANPNDINNVWFNKGYTDLNNLINASNRHQKSEGHVRAFLTFKEFGKTRVDTQLDIQRKIEITRHNEKVTKNRLILRRFIDITCFLAKQELSFRGHDESESSTNQGNYRELASLLSTYDPLLAQHLDEATVFTGLSCSIQNDLIDAVKDVVFNKIKNEINATDFIAVMIDETSDCSKKSQLTTIFRYIDESGTVQERFLGFSDVSSDHSARALSEHVIEVVERLGCSSKIVCQTYDGASVMSGALSGTQQRVRTHFPSAIFVHCFAHALNLILTQSVSFISECRIFFSTLGGLVSFFSPSSSRTYLLDSVVRKRLPPMAPTRWNFNDRLVETVCHYRLDIINCFWEIVDNESEWENDAIFKARGFINFLQSFETVFLLQLFENIYSKTGHVYNILQTKSLDISYCLSEVTSTKQYLNDLRSSFFDDLLQETTVLVGQPTTTTRRQADVDPVLRFRRLFNEILDVLIVNIDSRFSNLSQLKFLEILDATKYSDFRRVFPTESLNCLATTYSGKFDIPILRTELNIIYSHDNYQNKSPVKILETIVQNDLQEALPELCKLCKLVLTIPATSASAERSFSALKRIKSIQRNTMGQNRLSSLSFLSCEKELLEAIRIPREGFDFYDEVIKQFIKKERRMEYIFK